jgi:hypothetical protein
MIWDIDLIIPSNTSLVLPFNFTSRLLAVNITAANFRPTWYRSGFLRSFINFDGRQFVGNNFETRFGDQLFEIPFQAYQLEFSPQFWMTDTNIKIKQLSITETEGIIMGINFAPNPTELLSDEVVTTIAASITNIVLDPANPARREGFIVNKSNRNLWVKFGTAAATAAAPTSLVPPNSNINIPDSYTGVINGIWSGPTPTLNAEIHQFNAV